MIHLCLSDILKLKRLPLGELGFFYGGLSGKSKEDFVNGNGRFVPYMNVFSNFSVDLNNLGEVNVEEGERQNRIEYGDVLFTGSSETPDECGMSSVMLDKVDDETPIYLNSFCFGFRFNDLSQIYPAFYKHLFRSNQIRKEINKTANGVTRFNITKKLFAKIVVPIPSIEQQKEIARKLDVFTSLISNIDEEIELRKKQFSFTLEEIFSFEDRVDIESLPIGQVFITRNGYTPSTSNPDFWENGYIPWFKMEDIRENGRILSDSKLHITPIAVKGKGLFKANSIILATSATIGEHALITVDHLCNQRFTNFYPQKEYHYKISMKYVYYYMFIIDEWCKSHINQGGFASVDMNSLFRLNIPIPAIAIQQSIVEKLDTFTSLISKLQEERNLRQKQYEYYREKFLTFE